MTRTYTCNRSCETSVCGCGYDARALAEHDARLIVPTPPAGKVQSSYICDEQRLVLRAGVRNMALADAAALPIYDAVRDNIIHGMPAPEFFALLDGALSDTHNRKAA